MITGKEASESKIEEITSEAKKCMCQFEEKFLSNKTFVTGENISLADLVALEGMMQVWVCAWQGRGVQVYVEFAGVWGVRRMLNVGSG